jgi:hypothetical protein
MVFLQFWYGVERVTAYPVTACFCPLLYATAVPGRFQAELLSQRYQNTVPAPIFVSFTVAA